MAIVTVPRDVKTKHLSGGQWKARAMSKGVRASRESGRKKGLVPPQWAKNCARAGRAYKNNPNYDRWCEICTGDKIKWSKA